jgi:hypothetical protein
MRLNKTCNREENSFRTRLNVNRVSFQVCVIDLSFGNEIFLCIYHEF